MVGAVKSRGRRTAQGTRGSDGSAVSARLQRWPVRNYFEELQPSDAEGHPIDRLIDSQSEIRRGAKRARTILATIQRQAKVQDVLDFEEARNGLEWARVEAAYNLGFENGLLRGRREHLRLRNSRRRAGGLAVERIVSATIGANRMPPATIALGLLEVAYALLSGPPQTT